MEDRLILTTLPVDELRGMIAAEVRAAMSEAIERLAVQAPTNHQSNDLLTRRETADYLHVTLVTLYEWERRGILMPMRIGRRVLYRQTEVDRAMVGQRR